MDEYLVTGVLRFAEMQTQELDWLGSKASHGF
jgi:hypothetical protein